MIAMRSSAFLLPLALLGALSVLLCTAAPAKDTNTGFAAAANDRDAREQAKSVYSLGKPILQEFEHGDSGEPGRRMQESPPSGVPTPAPTAMPTSAPTSALTAAPTASPTSDSGSRGRGGGDDDDSLADDDSNDGRGSNDRDNNDRDSSASSGGLRSLPPSVALAVMASLAAAFAIIA